MPLFHSGVTAISLKQTEHIFPGRADKFTPSQVPVKPAAIRIYQQRGGHHYTTCIAFDFDAKRSDPETVVEEVTRLKNHLYNRHGEVIIDRSLNSGQHVYLPLPEETTLPTAKKFVHRLKSALALSTLDTAPMSGSKGAIRTPGARHKDGGHQMLVTNFEAAKAIIAYRNPGFDIKKALKELPESEHEKLDNLTIQYNVNDDARQRHIDAFTILRDNTIIGALTKGTWGNSATKKVRDSPPPQKAVSKYSEYCTTSVNMTMTCSSPPSIPATSPALRNLCDERLNQGTLLRSAPPSKRFLNGTGRRPPATQMEP